MVKARKAGEEELPIRNRCQATETTQSVSLTLTSKYPIEDSRLFSN